MNYWEECISEALDDIGLSITDDQIKTISSFVEAAHDNYGMAHGHDIISSNYESEAQIELRKIKHEQELTRQWELSTEPCKSCTTTGIVKDGWGRDTVCMSCNGKGRT